MISLPQTINHHLQVEKVNMATSQKIQTLVTEATIIHDQPDNPKRAAYVELDLEKFARLIVEECIVRAGVTDDTANEIREYFWPE